MAARVLLVAGAGLVSYALGQVADQPPEPPAATAETLIRLEGRVADADTNQPLPGVQVTMGGSRTVTDYRGEFALVDLRPGTYTVRAEMTGYLDAQRRVILFPFMTPETVVIRMAKAAAIEGVVEDADGSPVAGAAVGLSYRAGTTTIVLAKPLVTTGADGRFSIQGIPPGSYYLRASATTPSVDGQRPTQPLRAWRDVYYPRAPDFSGAAEIALASGSMIPGVRLRLFPPESYRVSGRVAGVFAGQNLSVQLHETTFPGSATRMDFNLLLNKVPRGAVDADGAFIIERVPPGFYNAEVMAGINPLGKVPIVVKDGNLEGVIIPIVTGQRLEGRIIDTTGLLKAGTMLYLEGGAREGRSILAWASEAGEFTFNDVAPGKYRFGLMTTPGAVVHKVEIGGRSTEGQVFEVHAPAHERLVVTLGKGGTIAGSVEASLAVGNTTAATVSAVSTPVDAALGVGQIHSTAVKADGTFSMTGIAPGEYRVCAWREEKPDLRALLGASRYQRQLDEVCSTVRLTVDGNVHVRLRPVSVNDFR